ncbi:hypothetical protein FF38_10512 [Lucilia cuprina]|uniref:Uncharacterized protein n=1 Tax=Lucilia cuprina TaxID=7375 RepID=A0A0L0CKP3_LUCCU|nr:hypothetical protein FF38_10512 [Lucilia cuprina]
MYIKIYVWVAYIFDYVYIYVHKDKWIDLYIIHSLIHIHPYMQYIYMSLCVFIHTIIYCIYVQYKPCIICMYCSYIQFVLLLVTHAAIVCVSLCINVYACIILFFGLFNTLTFFTLYFDFFLLHSYVLGVGQSKYFIFNTVYTYTQYSISVRLKVAAILRPPQIATLLFTRNITVHYRSIHF